jgi:hypothetical protein
MTDYVLGTPSRIWESACVRIVFVALLALVGSASIAQATPTVNSVTWTQANNTGGDTFTVAVSDPNGNTDISSIDLLINTSLTGYLGCYVHLDRTNSSL